MEAGSGDASVDLTETRSVQSVTDQTKRLVTAIGAQKLAQPLKRLWLVFTKHHLNELRFVNKQRSQGPHPPARTPGSVQRPEDVMEERAAGQAVDLMAVRALPVLLQVRLVLQHLQTESGGRKPTDQSESSKHFHRRVAMSGLIALPSTT